MLGIDSPDCVGMPRYQVFCLTPKTKRDPRVFLNKFFFLEFFFYFTQELTSIFKMDWSSQEAILGRVVDAQTRPRSF